MLFSLTACGGSSSGEEQVIGGSSISGQTSIKQDQKPQESSEGSAKQTEDGFYYIQSGVKIIPGMAVTEKKGLPEAKSTFERPSCAIEGNEIIYTYDGVEVTVLDDGKQSYVYSIFFADSSVKTIEGLAIGDDVSDAASIYGDDCVKDGNSITYAKGKTVLSIISQSESVISIEIRMAE